MAGPELTEPMRGLLAAIAEALNVPLPGHADVDEQAYNRLLAKRADLAQIATSSVLRFDDTLAAAAWLRAECADTPVTYTVYRPRTAEQQPSAGA
ncbi:hypothetical protein AB0L68_36510 [Streptomyces sp. NPDC052164]|uniref:hypothetical protein n=1 Tax=Streptomyces sp. NPDC052164 TaxID=3155529 RepID=UPI0034485181